MDVDAVQLAGIAVRAVANRTGDELAAALPGHLGQASRKRVLAMPSKARA
jgi:hypothetical protein